VRFPTHQKTKPAKNKIPAERLNLSIASPCHFFFFVSEQRKKSNQKKENLKGYR